MVRGLEVIGRTKQLMAGLLDRMASAATRSLRTSNRTPPRILVITPTDPGSRGDQAVLLGLLSELNRRGIEKITLLKQDTSWDRVEELSEFPLGSIGHLISRRPGDLMRRIRLGSQHEVLIVLGTDVMDGSYAGTGYLDLFKAARSFAESGGMSLIASISVCDDLSPKSLESFKRLPPSVQVSARDPISLTRISRTGVRKCFETADLSFLLDPAIHHPASQHLVDWIKQEKGENSFVLGLNINTYMPRYLKEISAELWVRLHVEALEKVKQSNPKLSLVLLPHDSRHDSDDFVLAAQLRQEMESRGWRCESIQKTFRPEEIKAVCAALDAVVTGRMHVALAALSTGTPALSLGYHGKFEGLYQRLELGELHLSSREGITANSLSSRIGLLFANNKRYRTTLTERLVEMRRDAAKSIDSVL